MEHKHGSGASYRCINSDGGRVPVREDTTLMHPHPHCHGQGVDAVLGFESSIQVFPSVIPVPTEPDGFHPSSMLHL